MVVKIYIINKYYNISYKKVLLLIIMISVN